MTTFDVPTNLRIESLIFLAPKEKDISFGIVYVSWSIITSLFLS